YSLPVVGIELCVVWMLVHYILEPYAMPRVFGPTYTKMDIVSRRSLTNHVVSFFLKVLCCSGAYAIWQAFIAQRPFYAPIKTDHDFHEATFTIGDLLAFCYLTVPTIYLFEIIYRANISIVSAVHHIGAVSINIMGLIIILSHGQRGFIAETEFKLILIYGTFEMIFEIFPHLAVILYRLLRDRPAFLYKVFLAAACGIFTGTFLEQIAIGYFYSRVWKRLPASYKAIGLILHVCFMAAQIHGGRVCLQIARKMAKEMKAKDVEAQEADVEGVTTTPMSMACADGATGVAMGQLQAKRPPTKAAALSKDGESGSTGVAAEIPDHLSKWTPPDEMGFSTDGVDVTDTPRDPDYPTPPVGEESHPQQAKNGTKRTSF
ncbi:hypothetical protein LshimejAT787_2800010, partial [Lyophyllum shimeji]